jgi:CHAD domain-containing protein
MPLDVREIRRRVDKLRKSLKAVSKNPTVDEVHDLRTRTRRVESILQGLRPDRSKHEKRLERELKSIRRAAGKVRDMDVLTSYVVGLGLKDDPNCLVRLVHHLGGERQRQATKLQFVVRKNRSRARLWLKKERRKLVSSIQSFEDTKFSLDSKDNADEAPLHAMSVALRLAKELAGVGKLDRDNLHQYRIEVKRLRYVLEMADNDQGPQTEFLEALQDVQDAIGEWHDWVALSDIAAKVLKHDANCKLLKKIHDTSERKFAEALQLTEQMRRRFLQPSESKPMKSRSKRKGARISGPVLVAASEIAA